MGSPSSASRSQTLVLSAALLSLLLAAPVSGNLLLQRELAAAVRAIQSDDKFSLVGQHLGNVSDYLTGYPNPRVTVLAPNDGAIMAYALWHAFLSKDEVTNIAKVHVMQGAYNFGRLLAYNKGARFWTFNKGTAIMKTSARGARPVSFTCVNNNRQARIYKQIYNGRMVVAYGIDALMLPS